MLPTTVSLEEMKLSCWALAVYGCTPRACGFILGPTTYRELNAHLLGG